MRQHHPRAAQPGGIGDDRPHRQPDRAVPAVMAAEVDAPRVVVDMRDPQLLGGDRSVVEAGGKEAARGVVAGKDRRVFGTLNLHPSS